VQQNISHTQSVVDTVETEACSAVTWAETMIFSSIQAGSSAAGPDSNQCAVWPGATTTTVKFQGGSTGSTTYAHLVSNANLAVESIDSLDGSETIVNWDGSDPDVKNKTVSASTLADHFLVISGFSTEGSAAMEFFNWNYRLSTTTNIEFFVARSASSGFDADWAAQLIDISGLNFGGGGGIGLSQQGTLGMNIMSGGFRQ